eukprot:7779377-Karenia_brevis.AAC.1
MVGIGAKKMRDAEQEKCTEHKTCRDKKLMLLRTCVRACHKNRFAVRHTWIMRAETMLTCQKMVMH